MSELARGPSHTYQCREGENYESMMANGGEPFACGSPITAILFFITFQILVFQIFVNLFVAVIIDAFLGQTDHFNLPIHKYSVQAFVEIWSQYDPEATGYIGIDQLDAFILDLVNSSEAR